ncbi:DUF2141 domain-containing protein [Gramella sp. GC03-9]|uniref:DUF2141 domain-containing protein n=1 Tax=Christiangramia oceanisediminis TaxID=2920386 RepID=A0A9X2KWV2_9FLAO|nr:DUF2141 domain-containing protein [Gramella oceanisediminis]MCP9200039.1 DUF2141 domain-containing protein [Gramella oceanisediminis]
MKTLIVLLAIAVGSCTLSQAQNTGNISAQVTNLTSAEGEVLFALYTADKFMKQEPDFSGKASITDGRAKVVFENVPAGTYAVVVLHDKNGNGRMDFDSSGMPMESFGTSGSNFQYGPPSWAEAKFDYEGGQKEVEIRL